MFVLGNFLAAVAKLLDFVLNIYLWIVIIRALLSWVNPDPYNPIVRFISQITDPLFYRVRRWCPWAAIGGIDFSPMLIMLGIFFLQSFLVQSLLQLAYTIAN
jgi:YggT family protein